MIYSKGKEGSSALTLTTIKPGSDFQGCDDWQHKLALIGDCTHGRTQPISGTTMLLRIFICFTIALLAGCSSNYQHSEKPSSQEYLDPSRGVLIFTPVDAQFESKPQEKSGYLTADAVRKAFAKHAKRAGTAYKCIEDECLKRLDSKKFGYYVKLKVLHWENQPNEWPSERDRIEIEMMVFDASTHKELARASFKGESPWPVIAAPLPQQLLAEPIAEFVATLYEEELAEPVKIEKPSRLI